MDSSQVLPESRQLRIAERDRKRAARACDNCRRQKEKCDGGIPCRRCSRLSRPCKFSARASEDGNTGTGPRSETRLSTVEPAASNVVQTKRIEYLEKIVQRLVNADNQVDLASLKKLAETADQETPNENADDASDSSEFDGVDDKISMQPLKDNVTHYSGEFSHWNFSMRIKNWIDRGLSTDTRNTRFKEYYRPEELQTGINNSSFLSSLPPRAIADFLVHCFFKHAQANYFYVQREWVDVKLDMIYQNPSSLPQTDTGSICVLLMLLAIGTQYAYLESLTEDGVDSSRNQQAGGNLFAEGSVGMKFYRQACQLLPDIMALSSLESVQACLLMGTYTLLMDASGLSYIYLNLALKLAVQNGMHRKYPGDDLDVHVRETRNRVWWTIFTIEKRVGIFHGRPRSIANADVDADLPVHRSDIWPSSNSTHVTHVLATLQLNMYLDKMAHAISVLKGRTRSDLTKGLAEVVNLQHELHQWWKSLPNDISPKETASPLEISRQSLHLQLEYCLVRMYVGRAFILPHDRTADAATSPASSADTPTASSNKKHLRTILVNDCNEAALSVMDTCRAIRSSIGHARASYTEFSSCRAALLVIVTQCFEKRSFRSRQALRDGLTMLKEMSVGSKSAHSEASLIEAFERAIANIDTAAGDSSSAAVDSGYADFKRWEELWKGNSVALDGGQGVNMTNMGLVEDSSSHNIMSSATPFFGVDGNFASFPQNLGDLSSFFGDDFGAGLVDGS